MRSTVVGACILGAVTVLAGLLPGPATASPAAVPGSTIASVASDGADRARSRWQTSALAVAPDGTRVYQGGNGFVHWMNSSLTKEVSSFKVGTGFIRDMALGDGGRTLYATSDDNRLYAISVNTNPLQMWSVPVGVAPNGLTLTADQKRVYVANTGSGDVTAVDVTKRQVMATIALGVGAEPWDVAANPTGPRIYVAMRDGEVLQQINTNDNTVLPAIPVGSRSTAVATDSTGARILVATDDTNDVTVVNSGNGAIIKRIPIGRPNAPSEPSAMAVSITGRYLYVRERESARIFEVDLASYLVTRSLTTGASSGDQPETIVVSSKDGNAYFNLFTVSRVVRATVPFIGASRPRQVSASRLAFAARITWQRPQSTGSAARILGYRVTTTSGSVKCGPVRRATCTITGLQAGKTYRFKVQALTSVGWGAAALSPRVVPYAPSRPTPTPTPSKPSKPTGPVVVVPS